MELFSGLVALWDTLDLASTCLTLEDGVLSLSGNFLSFYNVTQKHEAKIRHF